jgi:hypothetical protein
VRVQRRVRVCKLLVDASSDVASLGFDLPAPVDEGKLFIDCDLTAVITAERGEGTHTRQGLEEYRTLACVSQMQEDDDMQQSLPTETNPDTFVLRLYIAGQTPKCMRAFPQRVLAGLDVNVAAA